MKKKSYDVDILVCYGVFREGVLDLCRLWGKVVVFLCCQTFTWGNGRNMRRMGELSATV